MNKANRDFLKANEINTYSKPLGRPPKDQDLPNITTTWPKPLGRETKLNAPSAPAREFTESTTYEPSFPIQQNAGQECATLSRT